MPAKAALIRDMQDLLDRNRSLTVTDEFRADTGFNPAIDLVAFKREDELKIYRDPMRDTTTALLVGPREREAARQSLRFELEKVVGPQEWEEDAR